MTSRTHQANQRLYRVDGSRTSMTLAEHQAYMASAGSCAATARDELRGGWYLHLWRPDAGAHPAVASLTPAQLLVMADLLGAMQRELTAPLRRAEVAARWGLSKTTVTNAVAALCGAGAVVCLDADKRPLSPPKASAGTCAYVTCPGGADGLTAALSVPYRKVWPWMGELAQLRGPGAVRDGDDGKGRGRGQHVGGVNAMALLVWARVLDYEGHLSDREITKGGVATVTLSVPTIAEACGVAPSSAREALRKLERSGLLSVAASKGGRAKGPGVDGTHKGTRNAYTVPWGLYRAWLDGDNASS